MCSSDLGEYPLDPSEAWLVIPRAAWDACLDSAAGRPRPRVAIAADASPDQSTGAIAVAGRLPGGRLLVEVPEGDHGPGVDWIVPRLLELKRAYRPCAIVIDPQGPAAGLIDAAVKVGIEVAKPSANDVAQAFAQFHEAVTKEPRKLAHLGQPMLAVALAGSARRDVGDGGFAWARRHAAVDISPLVAATNALWALDRFGGASYDLLKSVAPPT